MTKTTASTTTIATTTPGTTQCPQLPDGTACPPGPPKDFPDPEECSNYWRCIGGCAEKRQCQEDYLFDDGEGKGYCNYPDQVECGDRPCNDPHHCPAKTTVATNTTQTTVATTQTTPSTQPSTITTTIATTTTANVSTTITTKTTASTTTIATTTPGTTQCPQLPDGTACPPGPPKDFPDPEECSNYWRCIGGCPE